MSATDPSSDAVAVGEPKPATSAAAVPTEPAETDPAAAAATPAPAPASTAAPEMVAKATATSQHPAEPPAPDADPDLPRSLRQLPEIAAVAAVKRFNPQAAHWAAHLRATYPTATPDGLARLAQRRFTRRSTATGAAASLATGWSAAADLAGTSWVNAELITHIAAAYGKQATAIDLLVLTGVHQNDESARAAIDGQKGHSASRAPITAAGKTATWAALKILARWWPGLAVTGGAAAASLNTERVAARAVQRFRAS
ncbi:hypothetical protein [Asanoa iriomotensis]|uniref:hypothetical protein n=1 Tax=Asanoa iriomotensis TaxID=234613 RepID=UPI00194245E4|nr:hypothetical protein [Asanoa iriomotensis]